MVTVVVTVAEAVADAVESEVAVSKYNLVEKRNAEI